MKASLSSTAYAIVIGLPHFAIARFLLKSGMDLEYLKQFHQPM